MQSPAHNTSYNGQGQSLPNQGRVHGIRWLYSDTPTPVTKVRVNHYLLRSWSWYEYNMGCNQLLLYTSDNGQGQSCDNNTEDRRCNKLKD